MVSADLVNIRTSEMACGGIKEMELNVPNTLMLSGKVRTKRGSVVHSIIPSGIDMMSTVPEHPALHPSLMVPSVPG
ncbi:hypothetical protein MRX96_016719 [Rhipicephalus microplus]